jgi:outer membrane protein TolC
MPLFRRLAAACLSISILALGAPPAYAGTPTPVELLDLIAGNPRLAAAGAATEIAEARLDSALSALRPRLQFKADAKRFQSMRQVETRNSDVVSSLEIVQPIYDFGRSFAVVDAARADARAQQAGALDVRNQLMLEGLALYYELHASDLDVQALQEDSTIAFFRMTRQIGKDLVGAADPIDLVDLRAKSERARYIYYSARSRNQELRLRLFELTGVAFDETTFTPSPPERGPFEVDVAKILGQAETALPALDALRRRKQAFAARHDAVGLAPRIEAYGRLSESTRNSRGRDDWALGARLVVPLYEGGARQAERARFGAEARRVEAVIEARRRALRREVHIAVLARNDNWRRIQAARIAYKAARRRLLLEQLQRNQDRQASIGSMSARLTHVEAELVRAIGAYRVAGARLAALMGLHPGISFTADFLEDLKVAAQ